LTERKVVLDPNVLSTFEDWVWVGREKSPKRKMEESFLNPHLPSKGKGT